MTQTATHWELLMPAIDVGSSLCYKILKEDGNISFRTTVRSLTLNELVKPSHIKQRDRFNTHISDRLGAASTKMYFEPYDLTPDFVYYEDTDSPIQEGSPEKILPTPEINDNFVNVEIMLSRGDEMAMGRVTKRASDSDSNPLGTAHKNPILDTRQYIVEFNDIDKAELAANVIATNMYAQCDPEGKQYVILDSLIDFCRSTNALCYYDQKVTANGRTHYRRSTSGWHLCCQWKECSTSWCKLSDLKESHPIETAEYSVAQGLDGEPAFN